MSVDEKPNLWWQHAGRAVLGERSEILGSEISRWGLAHRRYYRQLYSMYYIRNRSRLQWMTDLLRGCPNFSRDALIQLESQLGDGEIAQFRWWVWATKWAAQRRNCKVFQIKSISSCISNPELISPVTFKQYKESGQRLS